VLAQATGVTALPAAADPLQLAMLAVNPATMLHMLTRYVALSPATGSSRMPATPRSAVAWSGSHGSAACHEDRVMAATGGHPVRLALDAVAGSATARLARCLAPRGTLVVHGLL